MYYLYETFLLIFTKRSRVCLYCIQCEVTKALAINQTPMNFAFHVQKNLISNLQCLTVSKTIFARFFWKAAHAAMKYF